MPRFSVGLCSHLKDSCLWLLLLVHGLSLGFTYLMADDWTLLRIARDGVLGPWNFNLEMGRWALSPMIWAGFKFCSTVDVVVALRGLAIVGLIWAYRELRGCAREMGWEEGESGALAFLLLSVPGVLVCTAWTSCFPYTLSLALAVHAGRRAIRGDHAIATSALTLAMGIYPMTACVFIWPFLLGLTGAAAAKISQLRVGLAGLAIFGGCSAALTLYLQIAKHWLFPDSIFNGRSDLALDPADRLIYVVRELLGSSLTGWADLLPLPFAWVVGSLVMIGIGSWVFLCLRPQNGHVGLSVFLWLGVAWGPLLVVAEKLMAYRVLITVQGAWLILAWVGWRALMVRWDFASARTWRWPRAWAWLLLATWAGAAMFVVWDGLIAPNRHATQALRQAIEQRFPLDKGAPARLALVEAGPLDGLSQVRRRGEFGCNSTLFFVFGANAVRVLLGERFGPAGYTVEVWSFHRARVAQLSLEIPCLDAWEWVPAKPDEASRATTPLTYNAVLGNLEWIQSQVYYSSWFGLVDLEKWPRVRHETLGWIHIEDYPLGWVVFTRDADGQRVITWPNAQPRWQKLSPDNQLLGPYQPE